MTEKHTTSKYSAFNHNMEVAAILKDLRPMVSPEDRKAALGELNIGQTKMTELLNGKVRNLDCAVRLIKFLRKRIEKRRKAIA